MKKRQWILAAGILAVAMGGCGGQEETTTTCSSDEYGVKDTQTITAQGDRVTHLKERVEIDFADLGGKRRGSFSGERGGSQRTV